MAKKVRKTTASINNENDNSPFIRIFISWSGPVSRNVAEALKSWIPDVIEGAQPWISTQDIYAGVRWGSEIDEELKTSNFGILCLTKDNIKAPWILYEAGSLAKDVDIARVVPYRFGVSAADVMPPLGHFNHVGADRNGTLSLLKSINEQYGNKYEDARLIRKFEKYWPDLESTLSGIHQDLPVVDHRDSRELLEELLDLNRKNSHNDELRQLKQNVSRLMYFTQSIENSTLFNTGFGLVEYIGLVPAHDALQWGDGMLYAYWRSLNEWIEANYQSDDPKTIEEVPHYETTEEEVFAELQRRIMRRLRARPGK